METLFRPKTKVMWYALLPPQATGRPPEFKLTREAWNPQACRIPSLTNSQKLTPYPTLAIALWSLLLALSVANLP